MIEYQTDEWRKARLGWLTASRMADATARTKSGWGASRDNLMAALVCERLTDVPMESYTNSAMQWGIDHEPDAVAAYEWHFDCTVEPVGFLRHPSIEYAGATPDGRRKGEPVLLEFKCPQSATHIETLLTKRVAEKYIKQMTFQLACCPWAEAVDFSTFDPRMPPELQLWTFRLMRDDKAIAELESQARAFLAELDEKISALRAIGRLDTVYLDRKAELGA